MDKQSGDVLKQMIKNINCERYLTCNMCFKEWNVLNNITISTKIYNNICCECSEKLIKNKDEKLNKFKSRLYNRKNINELLIKTGIPLKYFDKKFITNSTINVFNSLKTSDMVYVLGETSGTGKTTIAYQCLKRYLWKGQGVIYIRSVDLCDDLQSVYNNKFELNIKVQLNKFFDVDVLIIDDIGKEKATEFIASRIYSIIDKRIIDCKKTIITSNLNPKQIEKIYDQSLVSRFCSGKIIKVSGNDFRINK